MAANATTPPAAATPRRRIRLGRWLIVGAALAFVAMIFVMLSRVEPIEIVNSRLDRAGQAVYVEGLVKNTGRKVGAIQLDIRLYDAQGHKLAEDKVAVAGLDSGQQARFKSPFHTIEGVSEFTIAIDRGRNPYGN
jgi:hypothetical protein